MNKGFATYLKSVAPFSGWSDVTIERWASEGVATSAPPGAVVQQAGTPADAVFLLMSGVLETMTVLPNGAWHGVSQWQAGGLLGLHTAFSPPPALRKQTWLATTAVQLLAIPFSTFHRCFENDAAMSRDVLALLSRHIDFLVDQVAYATLLSARAKVAGRLLLLAAPPRSIGSASPGPLKLTQGKLAEMLGVSRQTVNHALQEFEAIGLIRTSRYHVEVLCASGLQQILDGAETVGDK